MNAGDDIVNSLIKEKQRRDMGSQIITNLVVGLARHALLGVGFAYVWSNIAVPFGAHPVSWKVFMVFCICLRFIAVGRLGF